MEGVGFVKPRVEILGCMALFYDVIKAAFIHELFGLRMDCWIVAIIVVETCECCHERVDILEQINNVCPVICVLAGVTKILAHNSQQILDSLWWRGQSFQLDNFRLCNVGASSLLLILDLVKFNQYLVRPFLIDHRLFQKLVFFFNGEGG